MIKLTVVKIIGQPNGILYLKKGYDKTQQKARFNDFYMEVYENRADHVSNNLRLNEISILTFFQLYCKINRNKSEIFVEETYDLHPN